MPEIAPERAVPQTGARSAAISTVVVQTMAEYTGRGPTRARTHISEDLITVVLLDTLTKGERSLVRDGKAEFVLSARHAFQETMRHDLIAAVEQIMDRTVVAFLSTNHIDPDVAIESFVLAPAVAQPSHGVGDASGSVADAGSGV